MKNALVVYGGWEGHEPKPLSEIIQRLLQELEFDVQVSDSLDAFAQTDLSGLSLIVPIWTMGHINNEQAGPVFKAVQSGVGLAGCHGGMCDAFRNNTEWQFMTGGQWVAHPGNDGVHYTVHIVDRENEITRGIEDYTVSSEQYYMHVDPAVRVLATTRFPVAAGPHTENGPVDMPVVWTKRYGQGRVFYCSLGHRAKMMDEEPTRTIMKRGFAWAAQ